VFRYVAIHELCHLRWRGHGPRFWTLVEQRMPDFRQHRDWLRRHGAALHAAALCHPEEPFDFAQGRLRDEGSLE
jgi:hypothetical protein